MKTKILSVILFLTICVTSSAWAHGHREVAGKFIFTVGFVNEPAFAGEINGVDLRVTTLEEMPVEGVEKTLKVTVLKEEQNKSIVLPLHTKYKEPGHYAGYFLPTKSGAYVFIFDGEINGISVHERFESGKDKFHDIEEPIQFP